MTKYFCNEFQLAHRIQIYSDVMGELTMFLQLFQLIQVSTFALNFLYKTLDSCFFSASDFRSTISVSLTSTDYSNSIKMHRDNDAFEEKCNQTDSAFQQLNMHQYLHFISFHFTLNSIHVSGLILKFRESCPNRFLVSATAIGNKRADWPISFRVPRIKCFRWRVNVVTVRHF